MSDRRVVSKNLFNFQPAGVVDADILAKEKEMFEQMGVGSRDDIHNKMNAMADEDFAAMLNGMMDGMADTFFKSPLFSEVTSYSPGQMRYVCIVRLRVAVIRPAYQ